MHNRGRILAGLLVLLGACSPSPFVAIAEAGPIFTDPKGDNVGALDIATVNATPLGSNLVFQVTFFGPITDPSVVNGDVNNLFGFIDIDSDKNTATPNPPPGLLGQRGVDGFPNLGVDFYVSFQSLLSPLQPPGTVDVVDATTGLAVGTAPIVFTSNAVTVTVPLNLLLSSTGLVNYGVIAVDGSPAVSDLAPNPPLIAFDVLPVVGSVGVPEPGSAALLCLGLLSAGGWYWRRVAARLLRKT